MNLDFAFIFQIAFFCQGVVLLIDEFFFHYRRDVPTWERWGHPLDTVSVLFTFWCLYKWPENSTLFICLAIFSCLFVTKDEWIHKEKCGAHEQWLHSLLFILHPVVFFLAYFTVRTAGPITLLAPLIILGTFLVYQLYYWNYYENRKGKSRFSNNQ